jgi:hypothetical protein
VAPPGRLTGALALQALVVGLALLVRVPAYGVVLSEDPLEGKSLELGGTVRSFNMLLDGGALDLIPGASPEVLSLSTLRARLDWRASSSFRLVIHDELQFLAGSAELDAGQGPLALGQGRRAPLWAPLDWELASSPRSLLTDRIDWLWARASEGPLQVTLGRQPVTLGCGVLWTPIDLLAPFSPLQIDTEFKPGVDALRVDAQASSRLSLTALGVLGRWAGPEAFRADRAGSAGLLRLEAGLPRTHLGVMAGYIRRDLVGGLDATRDLGGADAHGAVTVTYVPEVERRVRGQAVFTRVLAGLTVHPGHNVNATVEFYYNGSGAAAPDQYLEAFEDPRLQVGEVYNVGRWYSGVVLDWTPHPLMHLDAALLANLGDPSLLFSPQLGCEVTTNTLIIAGAFLPAGRAPTATSARSEYGLYPYLYHVDLKLYF